MQAFQVTVRNKKRVGYNYELSLRFRGKHLIMSGLVSFTLRISTSDLLLLQCNSWLCLSGEWLIKEENKKVKGHLDIPEFSFGELDDLEVKLLLYTRGSVPMHLT